MQKIGMIGGLSWVSTAEYYKRLNQLMQERLGGVSSARIVLESLNRQVMVETVYDHKDEASACDQIQQACQAVERAGADFIVISCNDMHRFVPQIEPQLTIPFLHIADATADAIEKQGLKQVALIGIRKTMEGDFYQSILKRRGISTIVPNEQERSYIHDRIYDELVHNVFTEKTRSGYQKIIRTLEDRGAEGIILGCTEIPLLLSADQVPIPSFSTTELHCVAAIERALTGSNEDRI